MHTHRRDDVSWENDSNRQDSVVVVVVVAYLEIKIYFLFLVSIPSSSSSSSSYGQNKKKKKKNTNYIINNTTALARRPWACARHRPSFVCVCALAVFAHTIGRDISCHSTASTVDSSFFFFFFLFFLDSYSDDVISKFWNFDTEEEGEGGSTLLRVRWWRRVLFIFWLWICF